MDHLDEVEFLWETKYCTTHGFFMAWVGVGRVDYPTAIDNIAPTPSREGEGEGDFLRVGGSFFSPFRNRRRRRRRMAKGASDFRWREFFPPSSEVFLRNRCE